jgi:hypothetical protein
MALKTRIKKEQIEALATASKIMTSDSNSLMEAHTDSLASSTIASITLGTAAASKVVTADSSTEVSGLGLISVPKLQASTDLDIGAHGFRAANLTADGLTAARVVYTGTDGLLSEEAGFAYDATANELSVPGAIHGNMKIDTNQIISTNTNGDITISPNGTGSVLMGSSEVKNLLAPTQGTSAATKDYVDQVAQGLSAKDSVRVASDNQLTGYAFSGGVFTESSASGALSVDGIALADGDRVLLRAQNGNGDFAAHLQNGIYVASDIDGSSAVVLTRSQDLNSQAEAQAGAYFFVEEGSNADAGFVLTTDGAITINTTALAFTQFSGAGQITAGNGLTKTGNDINVVLASNSGLAVGSDSINFELNALASAGAAFVAGTDLVAVYDASASASKKMTAANFLAGCIDGGQMEIASNVIHISDSALGMGQIAHVSIQGRVIALSDLATNTEIVSGDHSDFGGLANVVFDAAHNSSAMNSVYLNGMRLTNKAGSAGDYVFAADGSGKVKIVFQANVIEDGDLLSYCIYGV